MESQTLWKYRNNAFGQRKDQLHTLFKHNLTKSWLAGSTTGQSKTKIIILWLEVTGEQNNYPESSFTLNQTCLFAA